MSRSTCVSSAQGLRGCDNKGKAIKRKIDEIRLSKDLLESSQLLGFRRNTNF